MERSLIICPIVIALSALTAQAQDKAPREIIFRTASWDKVSETLYIDTNPAPDKEKFEKVNVFTMSLSHEVKLKLRGENPVVKFYKKDIVDGEEVFTVRAQGKVKNDVKRYIYLLLPIKKGKKTYPVYSLADERKHAPWGSYEFFNLSNLNIGGVAHKSKFTLKPNGRKLLVLNLKPKQPIDFALFNLQQDGKHLRLARNTFHFNPEKHLKYFIYSYQDAMGRTKTKAKGIVEFKRPDPPSGAR